MEKRAMVVVFGDVCQSPRMMNHAKSFSDAGYAVDVVGYTSGSHGLGEELQCCNFVNVPRGNLRTGRLPRPVAFVVRLLFALLVRTLFFLWVGVFRTGRPAVIIVQV